MKLFQNGVGALLLVVAQGTCAVAQPAGLPTEEITVYAPYIVQKASSGPIRAPVTTVTMSRHVSYKELDLKTESGVEALEARVRQAADEICQELDHRYPKTIYVPISQDKNCAKNAAENGLVQVKAVVAAVREHS